MSKVGLTVRWLVVPLSFIAFNPATMAAPFPGAGVDTTASLGQFTLRLTKEVGDMLGIPGCPNAPACLITSPVLYDPVTKIGRSDPFTESDPLESDSAEGCPDAIDAIDCVNSLVKDSQLHFPSSGFIEGPAGTEEVHTKILSLDMKTFDNSYAVRLNPTKRSIGEVESTVGMGFPAESFFNVFVEIDVDFSAFGLGKKTLFNKVPLIIQNPNLNAFPPEVVYVHNASNSVGVYDKDNPDGPPIAGLVLAGHSLKPDLTGKKLSQKEIDGIGGDLFNDLGPEMPFPLSVKLNSLTATVQGNEVTINFETASEQDVLGLQLWSGSPVNGECTADLLNYINLNMVGEVNTVGSETTGATYQMTDNVTQAGTSCYALKEIKGNGDAVWIEGYIAKAIVN